MRRTGIPILVLLVGSSNWAVTASHAADDPRVLEYETFFRERIAPEWKGFSPTEKAIVVLDFARHPVPVAAEWLMLEVLLKEPSAHVQRAVVGVLAGYKDPATVGHMATLWEKKFRKPAEARALALHAFAGSKLKEAARPIGLGLKDRDPRVVQSACRVAGIALRREFLPRLVKLLDRKEWAIVSGALQALAELQADETLPQVFRVFCGTKSHRVRYDAWLTLRKLALDDKLPCDPLEWKEWWIEQRKDAQAQLEADARNPWGDAFPHLYTKIARPARFFGIPVLADRICLVIEGTQSMMEPWNVDHKAERAKPRNQRIPGFFNVKTRWGLTRNWIKEVLKNLPGTTEVGLVFYNTDIVRYPESGRLFRNSEKTRAKAFAFLGEGFKLKATPMMFDGLLAGWGFLKDGNPDYNFKKGCETILFVTDGTPTYGILAKKPDQIRDEAWRIAMVRNVRIHTVGVHYHSYELLKEMAKDSGGLYVHMQQAGDTTEPQDLDFWPEKKKAFEKSRKKR